MRLTRTILWWCGTTIPPIRQIGGVGGFNLADQETQAFVKNNTVQITETSIIGTKAVDETSFQFRDSHNNTNGVGTFGIPGINVSGSENTGGAPQQKVIPTISGMSCGTS